MGWIVLEVGFKIDALDRSRLSLTCLQFKCIIFHFCGMGEAIELGETVQNLTKSCHISTKVISRLVLMPYINQSNIEN